MSKIVVFAGPTLAADDKFNHPAIDFLPPATQGDVLLAVQKLRPCTIGIVDGCFETVPAVTHKEILWALTQGISVFGTASMGALRAAELGSLGMIGVGRIYQMYRDGILEDDDEVAICHAPQEIGYAPLSEAMVNIRLTMEAAKLAAVVDQDTASDLISIGKELHYKDRTYGKILSEASKRPKLRDVIVRLKPWIETNAVDQKRRDLLELLAVIDNDLRALPSKRAQSPRELPPSHAWFRTAEQYLDAQEISEPIQWRTVTLTSKTWMNF